MIAEILKSSDHNYNYILHYFMRKICLFYKQSWGRQHQQCSGLLFVFSMSTLLTNTGTPIPALDHEAGTISAGSCEVSGTFVVQARLNPDPNRKWHSVFIRGWIWWGSQVHTMSSEDMSPKVVTRVFTVVTRLFLAMASCAFRFEL